jgi:hypothetical protein
MVVNAYVAQTLFKTSIKIGGVGFILIILVKGESIVLKVLI